MMTPTDEDEGKFVQDTADLTISKSARRPPSNAMASGAIQMPPQTTTTSQKMVARDITEEFTKAASALDTGQLVKDEYFTLFEAVGALEIMDSKMDSGYLAPGETLEDQYDAMRELLPEEVLGVMDQLLCYEMAWHMGHPLPQTLFTSIYIDRLLWPEPKSLDQAQFYRGDVESRGGPLVHLVLRAYCLCLIKTCDFVHKKVSTEHFYEEEDFVTQLYNRKLLSDFTEKDIQDVLDEAQEWLKKQKDMDLEIKDAIDQRLIFRGELLTALQIDSSDDPREKEMGNDAEFMTCQLLLHELERTMPLGKPVEESCSVKIQRRLASSVPPRPMVKIGFNDALTFLTRLCQDAVNMKQLLHYSGSNNLLTSVWVFQSRKPEPSIYIRSLLQSILLSEMKFLKTMSIKQFLFNDLAEIVLPFSPLLRLENDEVEVPSNPLFQIAKHMDDFVKRAAQSFLDVFRTACLNRARIRRTLCHTIIDWDSLQMDAEDLDTTLRNLTLEPPTVLSTSPEPTYSYPLSSWTYHHKLRQLRLILQLGFELSIYAADELAGMYWYLSHICATHLAHIDRIRTFTTSMRDRGVPILGVPTSAAKGKETVANPHFDRDKAISQSLAILDRISAHLRATDALALALHALFALLDRHSLIPRPSRPYSSDAMRYELRMKPFLPIGLPELVPFAEFAREVSVEGKSDTFVLERAGRAVSEARKAWEEVLAGGWASPTPEKKKEKPVKAEKLEKSGREMGKRRIDSAYHDDDDDDDDDDFDIDDDEDDHEPVYTMTIESEWTKDVKDTLRACIGASIAVSTVKKAITQAHAQVPGQTKGKGKSKGKSKTVPLKLKVGVPEVGDKGRWHDWWAVPKVVEG